MASNLLCPACGSRMERKSEPDLTLEECLNCSGLFLDKGELNALATQLSGNIELCSLDTDQHQDRFPPRTCPKCDQQPMRKVNLLEFSELIFDFCPGCEGFFLDRGELPAMNTELEDISAIDGTEEFRGYRAGRFIRIDRRDGVTMGPSFAGLSSQPVDTIMFRIAVYFAAPLNLSLRLGPETWTVRLARLLHLDNREDISTGDSRLDWNFVIRGDDAKLVTALFSSDDVRRSLLDFMDHAEPVAGELGTLEISDRRVCYREGPYRGDYQENITAAADDVLDRLSVIVDRIEGQLPALKGSPKR